MRNRHPIRDCLARSVGAGWFSSFCRERTWLLSLRSRLRRFSGGAGSCGGRGQQPCHLRQRPQRRDPALDSGADSRAMPVGRRHRSTATSDQPHADPPADSRRRRAIAATPRKTVIALGEIRKELPSACATTAPLMRAGSVPGQPWLDPEAGRTLICAAAWRFCASSRCVSGRASRSRSRTMETYYHDTLAAAVSRRGVGSGRSPGRSAHRGDPAAAAGERDVQRMARQPAQARRDRGARPVA